MPEYKKSVGDCPTGDGGKMQIQFYGDGEPKRNRDRTLRTKCDMCNEPGRVSEADARSDID